MFQAQRFTQLLDRIRQTLRSKRLRADYLLQRSILYFLLTILGVADYALLVGGLSLIFGEVIGANNPWLIGLMVLVLALALLPLRSRLQKGIDALFLRGQRAYGSRGYHYRQHIQDFTQELTSAIELASILRTLRRHIVNTLAPGQLHIYIHDPLNDRYLAALEGAKPALALVLVDLAWQMLFEAQPGAEIAAVQEALGAEVPIAGGYTLGQIVPSGEGTPQFLNQHMVVMVFGEAGEKGNS